MRNWKRRLALLLTAVLLISALPLNAAAAEDLPPEEEAASVEEVLEEVAFRVGTLDVIATSDPEKPGSEDEDGNVLPYVPFEDDGSYTIILPVGVTTPYTVWFLVDGREFPYVFGTESDTTTIGGHEFRVQCQEMPEIPEDEQLFVTVGGKQIPLIPEDVPTEISMLPLEVKHYTLNLSGLFPEELKEVGIDDLFTKLTEQGGSSETPEEKKNAVAWRELNNNDDYIVIHEGDTLDLSDVTRFEMIVGKPGQLESDNLRYIVTVSTGSGPESMVQDAFTFSIDDSLDDPIDRCYYNSRPSSYNPYDGYQISVKSEASWDGDSPIALKLVKNTEGSFWTSFGDLSFEIYEGYHETAENLSNPITSAFTGSGFTADYSVDNREEPPSFTAVFSRGENVVYTFPFHVEMWKLINSVSLDGLYSSAESNSSVVRHQRYDSESGQTIYMMEGTNPLNAEYYVRASYYHNSTPVAVEQIGTYVEKTVDGNYTAITDAASRSDITSDLFGGGYKTNCSSGKILTIFLKDGTVRYLRFKTEESDRIVQPNKLFADEAGTNAVTNSSNYTENDPVTNLKQYIYRMTGTNPLNAEYFVKATLRHNEYTNIPAAQIKDYVEKTVDGYYTAKADAASNADITDKLFGTGYKTNCSSGKTFTVFLKNGSLLYLSLKTTESYGVALRGVYESADENAAPVANYKKQVIDSVTEVRQNIYTMATEEKPLNAEYFVRADYHFNGTAISENLSNYVEKTVDGYYTSKGDAAGMTDITSSLFGDGYKANCSNGKTFTIFLKNGSVKHLSLKTEAYVADLTGLPEPPDPRSSDTYFQMETALQGETELKAYVMPFDADSYYYNGFQTVFLLDEDGDAVAADSKIKPVFYNGTKVTMFAGHDRDGHAESGLKQESRVSEHDFQNGKAILYSAAAENDRHLKNYWVTFLTKQSGAKLFVNGVNGHKDEETGLPERQVILSGYYDNHHDVFFANIGDADLTGLSVELDANAQKLLTLDEYWDIGAGEANKLAPFNGVEEDASGYGELANVSKIRLLPKKDENGKYIGGDINGILTIKSNGGEEKIKLTGKSGVIDIITEGLVPGVKYVHYSSLVQTDYMYAGDDISFDAAGLPDGLNMKPNGEIYGVPTKAGSFQVTVTATNNAWSNLSVTKTFTLEIKENTDENVAWATMDENQGYPFEPYESGNISTNGMIPNQNYTITDQVFHSSGAYDRFMNVYLDGRPLQDGTDYISEEGSTKITVRAQTFRNAGDGKHTISAEFRPSRNPDNTNMKRTAQNFTISGLSTPSYNPGGSSGGSSSGGGSSSSNRRPSSGTPKPSTKPSTPTQTPATSTEPKTTAERFSDISAQQWFYPDVDWAFKNNLMLGVTDSAYHPYDKISSITGVVVLSRMEKVDLSQQPLAEGIPDGQWYTPAESWAKSIGILPEGPFQGSAAMSRGEMAVMLLKYLKHLDVDCTLLGGPVTFTDASMMTQEQNDAFQVLYQFGIFKGVGNQTMDVSGSTTRAQFAALLHRLSVFAEAQQKDA